MREKPPGEAWLAVEVADDTEPPVGVIGDRAADAVLVDVPGTTQAEIGIPDGGVDGLGARRKGEEEQPKLSRSRRLIGIDPFERD